VGVELRFFGELNQPLGVRLCSELAQFRTPFFNQRNVFQYKYPPRTQKKLCPYLALFGPYLPRIWTQIILHISLPSMQTVPPCGSLVTWAMHGVGCCDSYAPLGHVARWNKNSRLKTKTGGDTTAYTLVIPLIENREKNRTRVELLSHFSDANNGDDMPGRWPTSAHHQLP